jgi:hypothetical protein
MAGIVLARTNSLVAKYLSEVRVKITDKPSHRVFALITN